MPCSPKIKVRDRTLSKVRATRRMQRATLRAAPQVKTMRRTRLKATPQVKTTRRTRLKTTPQVRALRKVKTMRSLRSPVHKAVSPFRKFKTQPLVLRALDPKATKTIPKISNKKRKRFK